MAFDRLKTTGSAPQTGGELPPVGGTASSGNTMSLKEYVQSLIKSGRWNGTAGPAMVFAYLRSGGIPKGSTTGSAGTTKPGATKPGTAAPQWSFKPNPMDQPSYATPMGNAAAYTINPPAQQWMFDPATGGQGAPPQWYGQPVVPNSQPPSRY